MPNGNGGGVALCHVAGRRRHGRADIRTRCRWLLLEDPPPRPPADRSGHRVEKCPAGTSNFRPALSVSVVLSTCFECFSGQRITQQAGAGGGVVRATSPGRSLPGIFPISTSMVSVEATVGPSQPLPTVSKAQLSPSWRVIFAKINPRDGMWPPMSKRASTFPVTQDRPGQSFAVCYGVTRRHGRKGANDGQEGGRQGGRWGKVS